MRILTVSPPSRIVWIYAWTASRTSWERFPCDVLPFRNASISSRFSFSSRNVIRSFSSIRIPRLNRENRYDEVIHHSRNFRRVVRRILAHGTYSLCQLSYDVGQRASIVARNQAWNGPRIFILYAIWKTARRSHERAAIHTFDAPRKALRESSLCARVAKKSRARRGRRKKSQTRRAARRSVRPRPRARPKPRRAPIRPKKGRAHALARAPTKARGVAEPGDLRQIEAKWQSAWERERVYGARADPGRPKWYSTVPYPYMNGYQHLGFGTSFLRAEFQSRFRRMLGYNVLHPQAFHCTGLPILGAAKRIAEKEPQQWEILRKMGIPDQEIPQFADPMHWIDVFPRATMADLKALGAAIDWRRSFITTPLNPPYDAFVRWQFHQLKDGGFVKIDKHPVIWCPKDQAPIGDHDRLEGEGETPVEYTLLKFPLADGRFLVAATIRPETVFGQTNLWIDPDVEYVVAGVGGERWIVNGLAADRIRAIQPISIIRTPGWGPLPGVEIVERMGIRNQREREKLEAAKAEVYKSGFYQGVLNENCGPFSGIRVEVAKEEIRKELTSKGQADRMYEPSGPVVCRCMTPAIVKIVDNQWFLAYGDPTWKVKVHEAIHSMRLYPPTLEKWLDYVTEWLRDWPCTHHRGLGTILPWDSNWVIESLSDSTIYMAYYTIAHALQGERLRSRVPWAQR